MLVYLWCEHNSGSALQVNISECLYGERQKKNGRCVVSTLSTALHRYKNTKS